MPAYDLRAMILTTINEMASTSSESLRAPAILQTIEKKLGNSCSLDLQQAILTQWHELFRTGYLAGGFDIMNPDLPYFHITDQGQRSLSRLSRDPGNPGGYLNYLDSISSINVIARSYVQEALSCFVSDLYKASAVMVGAAAESLILNLRDTVINKHNSISSPIPSKLSDWKVKIVLEALKSFFDLKKNQFDFRDEYDAYWSAFTQQIRSTRNDAGHPSSVDPITQEAVHSALLVFPELAKLSNKLENWTNKII